MRNLWQTVSGAIGVGSLVVVAIVFVWVFGSCETQDFEIPESVWIGTPLSGSPSEAEITPWVGPTYVRLKIGGATVASRFLYAEHGAYSDYVVMAFGSEATVTDAILGSTPGPGVERGYRPLGDVQRANREESAMAAPGAVLVWRKFKLDTERGWEARVRRVVDRYERGEGVRRPAK